MQHTVPLQRMVFSKQQIEDIRKFRTDLQKGDIDVAFEGSLLEGMAFLKGVNDIVGSCSP